jgi:hypothetical protein
MSNARRNINGSRFLTGGHRLFVDPLQSSTQLVRSSAAPHRLHDLRIVPSGLNEPQFRQRHLAGAENRENNSDRVGELP